MHLVAIGDSIIQGKAAHSGLSWIEQACRELARDGYEISLTNRGEGGDNIEKVSTRLNRDCLDLDPDIVVLGVGANDCRYRPSLNSQEIPLKRFSSSLNQVIRRILDESPAQICLSGQVPVVDHLVDPYKLDKHYRRDLQIAYEDEIRKAAFAHSIAYIEYFPVWIQFGEEFIMSHLDDGLHPNNAGHKAMAETAHAVLQRVVSSLTR